MLKSRFAGLTHINIHHGAVIPRPSDLLSLADWALGLPVNNLLLINDGGRWSLGLLISGGGRWGLGSLFFNIDMVGHALAEIDLWLIRTNHF
jgi:hypothetical protein